MSELGCDLLYFGNKVQENKQFKAPYVLRTDGNKELIQAQLLPRVGQEVNVSWLANHNTGRNSNPPQTQMSIQGELEGMVNKEGEGIYRVLINDQTYTYFFDSNIWQISQKDKDARLIILIDICVLYFVRWFIFRFFTYFKIKIISNFFNISRRACH